MEEIENCIWGLGVSATVQMSHLMQIFNFSLRDCVFTIHYGFDVEKNGVGCCKCTKFGPGATFLIFLLHFHDLEINEEWQRRWWVCGCGVWENSMQARMHPPTAPPTYQSDRLLGHWLPCVCVRCYASQPRDAYIENCAQRKRVIWWASGMLLGNGVKWPVQLNILTPQNLCHLEKMP